MLVFSSHIPLRIEGSPTMYIFSFFKVHATFKVALFLVYVYDRIEELKYLITSAGFMLTACFGKKVARVVFYPQ